jgi:uncharacterized membrane protein
MFAKSEPDMRKTLLLLALLLLVAGSPASARAASDQEPVVHAALFWISGCPHCTQVLTNTLPPIKDKYSSRLSLLAIELVTTKDIDALYALGTSLGLAREQVGVPFLLIDRTVLIGVDEIHNRLSALIDQYISSGGVGYADLPILADMLAKGIAYTSSEPYLQLASSTTTGPPAIGIILAWAIMAIMGVALILAILMIRRAFQGKPLRERKGWLDIAIPVLSLIGLGASIYLTYVEVTHTRALCGPVGDCNAVQSSPYARLFGFFPVGLLGAIGYVAILAAWFWRRLRSDGLARIAGPAMYGMALFGTLFSIYLTYLELFVIHAVCIWCLSSAVIITALMLLNLPPITQWLAISDEEE